jgi:hypothetical protein
MTHITASHSDHQGPQREQPESHTAGLDPREFSRGQILQLADWGGQFARRWHEAPPSRRFAPRPAGPSRMRAATYGTPVAEAAE